MNDTIRLTAANMGQALGEAISKHVRATRLEDEGRPTFQANRSADAAFRKFLTKREKLVKTMVQAQMGVQA